MRRALAIMVLGFFVCLVAIVVLSGRAHAQQPFCAPTDALLTNLLKKFHEFVLMSAQAENDTTVYLTRSATGTWTVVIARQGVGCITAAGQTSELANGV